LAEYGKANAETIELIHTFVPQQLDQRHIALSTEEKIDMTEDPDYKIITVQSVEAILADLQERKFQR